MWLRSSLTALLLERLGGGRKAQPIIDTKNSAMSIDTSIAIIYNNNAEGGTRTRTAFWARGFSYHYSFRYLTLHFKSDSLWSGRCLLRACFILLLPYSSRRTNDV